MVEGVHALDDVHHQVGEAHVVLHDQRVDGLGLHHVVHQVEPLGVLQAALRQAVVGTVVVDGAALETREGGDESNEPRFKRLVFIFKHICRLVD